MHIYLIKIAIISRSSVTKRPASRATVCGRVWVTKLRGGIRLQSGGVRWFTIAILIISAYKHKLTTLYERCMNAIVKTKRSEQVDIFYLRIFTKETHFYISSGHSQKHWAAERRSPIGRRATPLRTLIGPGRRDPQKPWIMGSSPRRSSFEIKRWVPEASAFLTPQRHNFVCLYGSGLDHSLGRE